MTFNWNITCVDEKNNLIISCFQNLVAVRHKGASKTTIWHTRQFSLRAQNNCNLILKFHFIYLHKITK